jgi:NAD(P)-dependent dehydrogenase (short-subunit alcohol dehydrogenase family)
MKSTYFTMDFASTADLAGDIADSNAVTAATAELVPGDLLVNLAGIIGPNKPLWEISETEWHKAISDQRHRGRSTWAAMSFLHTSARLGPVRQLSSVAGKDGNALLSASSVSKAALIGMTKSLGKDIAAFGVLVKAIAAAVIASPLNATSDPDVLARSRA